MVLEKVANYLGNLFLLYTSDDVDVTSLISESGAAELIVCAVHGGKTRG